MAARTFLISVLILAFVGIARAGRPGTFDNSDISGTYVVALSGHGQPNLLPQDPANPGTTVQALVGIGTLTFDGMASITAGSLLINANGDFGKGYSIGTNAGTGTYSVASDGSCAFSIPLNSPLNNVLSLNWACVIESPEKVHFIGEPTSTTLYALTEGTLTKQLSKNH